MLDYPTGVVASSSTGFPRAMRSSMSPRVYHTAAEFSKVDQSPVGGTTDRISQHRRLLPPLRRSQKLLRIVSLAFE